MLYTSFEYWKDHWNQHFYSLDEKIKNIQNIFTNHRHCPKCGFILHNVGTADKLSNDRDWFEIKIYWSCKEGHDFFSTKEDVKLRKVKNDK